MSQIKSMMTKRLGSSNGTMKTEQKKNILQPTKKSMSEKMKPFAIFGVGLYLGLAFFKDDSGPSGRKREGSAYLKDLKENFERGTR
jgi:hypothetical protein